MNEQLPPPDLAETMRMQAGESQIFSVSANRSIEAERCLLGCLLQNQEIIQSALSRGLSQSIFYRSEHAHICRAILALENKSEAVDVITVFEFLNKSNLADEAGGLAYINSVSQSVASSANMIEYLKITLEKAKRKELYEALLSLAEEATTDVAISDLIAKADATITSLNSKARVNAPVRLSEAMRLAFLEMDAKTQGTYKPLLTGLTSLDERLGGLERGDLVVIGAKPSHGKTAISLEIGLHMAREYGVGMLQMEMSNKSLGFRVKSRLSHIGMKMLKDPVNLTNQNWDRIAEAYVVTDRLKMWLHEQPALSIEQIFNYAKQLKSKDTGLDVLIVDHIHLTSDMSGQKLRRDQELARVSGGLKRLAKELDCVVICLAQLNKGVEGRPRLKDLRECGAIEQDADIVMLNYYPFKDTEQESDKYIFDLDIAKCRNGETGRLTLSFDGATQTVGNAPTQRDYQAQAAPSKRRGVEF